jgi:hypothetical protein
MTCLKQCNQGRDCDCDRSGDRAAVVIISLILIAVLAMGFGIYKLVKPSTGSPCSVEVKFKDSTATYIGRSV